MYKTIRAVARAAGQTEYRARGACPRCGDTLRQVANDRCAVCTPSTATLRRDALARGDRTFISTRICGACGSTTRLAENNRCAPCSVTGLDPLSARERARAAGERFYIGPPCHKGHDGKRYVSKAQCYECQMVTSAARPRGSEQERIRRRAWRVANREAVRAAKAAERATLHKATIGTDVTGEWLTGLKLAQNNRCAYCGEHDVNSLDHKTPLSRGGPHTRDNLQWLCAFHNMSKNAQTDAEYRDRNLISDRTPWDAPYGWDVEL